jgi:putative transposase
MPRAPRIDLPNTVYHVYDRGNNKTAIYRDDRDCRKFLNLLVRVRDAFPFSLLGFSLMGNHYHLQLRTHTARLAKVMHALNNLYAGYFNDRHGQVGHLFQNRYHSIPVWDTGYLLRLNRYIHLNPVAAGLVSDPAAYRWSSYSAYLRKKPGPLVESDTVLNHFTLTGKSAIANYREFVEEGLREKPEFSEQILLKTRSFGTVQKKAQDSPLGPSPSTSDQWDVDDFAGQRFALETVLGGVPLPSDLKQDFNHAHRGNGKK